MQNEATQSDCSEKTKVIKENIEKPKFDTNLRENNVYKYNSNGEKGQ